MNRKFSFPAGAGWQRLPTLLLALALSPAVWGANDATGYTNNSTVLGALQIDATNFVNNSYFSVATSAAFQFSDTRNFINRNQMVGNPGFEFDTQPPIGYIPNPNTIFLQRAASFYNADLAGSSNCSIIATSKLSVDATNIWNRGLLQVGSAGVLSLRGDNVDLSRSAVQVLGFNPNDGFIANYWGYNTNSSVAIPANPGNLFKTNYPSAPPVLVTSFLSANMIGLTNYLSSMSSWPLQSLTSNLLIRQFIYTNQLTTNIFNETVQAVFLHNPNTNLTADIVGVGATTGNSLLKFMIRLGAVGTNIFGQRTTNYLYIADTLGTTSLDPTNAFDPKIGSFGGVSSRPTYVPKNYTVTRANTVGYPSGIVNTGAVYSGAAIFNSDSLTTNYNSAAFGVTLTNIVQPPNYPQTMAGLPGQVIISAARVLDLTYARIQSQNYVKLEATNHFVGNTNASFTAISTPYCDISLASTNGTLVMANLMLPTVPSLIGSLDLCSLQWTNTLTTGTITNNVQFHALMVDARVSNIGVPRVLNLNLRATNVIVGETYHVLDSLFVDADTLTIQTNGLIDYPGTDFTWGDQLPYLRSFTNSSSLLNAYGPEFYFVSHNRADYSEQPYDNFINNSNILTSGGVVVEAGNFFSAGLIEAFYGPITIQSTTLVLTATSPLLAPAADISLTAGTLNISNAITAARSLTLSVTNVLNAGSNYWSVGDGFNLPVKPATGDLSGVTVYGSAFPYANVFNTWAGADLGATAAGFTNNAALGWLILDGGANSLFTFLPATGNNALYVDRLDLTNSAVVVVASGMKIYFSKLYTNGVLASAQVLTNSGNFAQVSHVSLYGYSIAFAPGNIKLNVSLPLVGGMQPKISGGNLATVSWNSVAAATNTVYYKDDLSAAAWKILTKFTSGPADGLQTVTDAVRPGGRFYQVRVDPPAP